MIVFFPILILNYRLKRHRSSKAAICCLTVSILSFSERKRSNVHVLSETSFSYSSPLFPQLFSNTLKRNYIIV
jgi:hypothetical protein